MEIKARVFCLCKFYCSFITQSTSKLYKFSQSPIQLVCHAQAQFKPRNSFTNSFTVKAVPHMLSSVLTDTLQMLPSAVSKHTKIKTYQYMSVKICIKHPLVFLYYIDTVGFKNKKIKLPRVGFATITGLEF